MTSSRVALALFFACYSLAHSAELQPFEAVEPHMGTLFRIKLYASDERKAETAFRAAFERIGKLDEAFSDYKPESEVNRVTVAAVGRPVKISADLFRVLSAAQAIAAETNGAFDVTLGPLTHLWRDARKTGQFPGENALRSAAAKCGFRKMHLNNADRSITMDEAEMQLDLGGIAKGDAADQALDVLRGLGVASALVAASGDLAFSDAPPGRAGWSVGVDSLDSAGAPFTRVLQLKNAAVSTSGDTQQRLESGGKRYSHIIDPRTGIGLTEQLTVTVVAPHGCEADALTKVVSVLGRERGLAFIEQRQGVSALVVDRSAAPAKVSVSQSLREDQFEREF